MIVRCEKPIGPIFQVCWGVRSMCELRSNLRKTRFTEKVGFLLITIHDKVEYGLHMIQYNIQYTLYTRLPIFYAPTCTFDLVNSPHDDNQASRCAGGMRRDVERIHYRKTRLCQPCSAFKHPPPGGAPFARTVTQ
jgi:hypothetical protein